MVRPSTAQPYILRRMAAGMKLSSLLTTNWKYTEDHLHAHHGYLEGEYKPVSMRTIEALLRDGKLIEASRSNVTETLITIEYALAPREGEEKHE